MNGLAKRGRKAAELPEYVETRISDGKVRCRLCFEYSKLDYRANWVLATSFSTHKSSTIHLKSVGLQAAAQMARVAARATTQQFATLQDITMQMPENEPTTSLPTQEEKDMWASWNGHIELDPGPEDLYEQERCAFDRKATQCQIWGEIGENEDDGTSDDIEKVLNVQKMRMIEEMWDETEQSDILSELLENTYPVNGDNTDYEMDTEFPEASGWFPYPSKLAFLLDTVDNLPRMRISSSLMKVLLWLLREVGVHNVPSFDGLRTMQKKLKKEHIVPTIHTKSPKGNTFSFNDPRALVANDWANPIYAPHIRRYPVIPTNGVISEVWHANKWRQDLDRHCLSPMYDAGNERHYFIDEPAMLESGVTVIPLRWLEDEEGEVWFDAWKVDVADKTKISTIKDDKAEMFHTSKLKYNMLDLTDMGLIPDWSSATIAAGHTSRMPNPDRALAEGHPIYVSMIDIFGDDVSGNRSKSWNKHWNMYMTHRNLPRKILHQSGHIHFISTSTHAPIPEQFHAIKEVIEATHHTPIRTHSAVNGQETRLKLYCNCAPGDNPAQSENCGHIGGQGNFPCRKCKIGGSQQVKETNDGFQSFFSAGEKRSAEETLRQVEIQVKTACLGVAQSVKTLQTDSGVKDSFTQHWLEYLIDRSRTLQKQFPMRPLIDIQRELMEWVNVNKNRIFNPFLTLKGLDISRDTPVEILHTILLGVVKYSWYGAHSTWNDSQKKTYADRLQATEASGLSIHAIRANYIMQYANSLIGRQLKTLAQVNAFHIYDLVDNLQFLLTKAVGELSALLWFPEIRNLDEYLADVETAAGNVLDIAALIDPSKIIMKLKYHLLVHLREDILRFGPLVGVATETYESFNAIFRLCSVLSNHLAPSRDIALQLADQEVVRHLLAGGSWLSSDGRWKTSGPLVTRFFSETRLIQTLLGHRQSDLTIVSAGTVKLEPLKREKKGGKIPRQEIPLQNTLAAHTVNVSDLMHRPLINWHLGKHVLSQAQDECGIGSWVFAKSPFSSNSQTGPITGRILEIIQSVDAVESFVVLDIYQVTASRHDYFGMPILERRMNETTHAVVPTNAILFQYNAQHDCREAKCVPSGKRQIIQERAKTDLLESFIEHKALDRYLINTHAFHNAHLIRAVLPRDLTRPIPYSNNRETDHVRIAAKLRDTQGSKRKVTAEKKKATAEKKATDAAAAQLSAPVATGRRKRSRTEVPREDTGASVEDAEGDLEEDG